MSATSFKVKSQPKEHFVAHHLMTIGTVVAEIKVFSVDDPTLSKDFSMICLMDN